MVRQGSIHTQLIGYVALLVLLAIGVAVTASVVVSQISRNAESIDHKWLAGTRTLSELGGQVAKFRLAETDRALTSDQQGAGDAEAIAWTHRNAVDAALDAYIRIVGTPAEAGIGTFRQSWGDYLLVHDAWVRAYAYRRTNNIARASSSLDWRYRMVDQALADLESANDEAAQRESAAAQRSATSLQRSVIATSVLAVLLAMWLSAMIRKTITRPLASMTAALTRLAEGSLDTMLPEAHRDDEIGAMAKAFEVFRTNAADLERAHAQTRAAQMQADLLARHDALTGLPNRRVFSAELEIALQRTLHEASYCAVILIDLDRFKPVNDVHGHAAGDQVLCEVARRLSDLPGTRKLVARLGGDEFAIIVETGPDLACLKREALDIASTILLAIQEPIVLGDVQVEIGASIGIACSPTDATRAEDVIRASDLAMYRAKQSGHGTFRFFEQSMDEELRKQALIEDDLRHAIRTGQIRPFYQPLIGLYEDRVHGFEVLARWQHPEFGAIPPDRFIVLAERLGLIEALTTGILRQACRDTRDWGDTIRIAVNVSPVQLADRGFPAKILSILAEENFAPSRLEIEITESALVGDIDLAKEVLTTVQAAGVSVSLDDFGTGYSSLYHLRNLKFDKLKLDRSFVQSMRTNTESAKIVNAVLGLARSLGMPVVAEGVEDQAALSHLTQLGCDFGQGYFFSRAVPPEIAAEMVAARAYRKIA